MRRSHVLVAIAGLALLAILGLALAAGQASADPGWRRGRDRPQCTSAGGATACGYHCAAGYGQVRCAQTPAGACIAAYGQITCWDPEPRAQRASRRAAAGECIAQYGAVGCGYDCAAGYGQLRCAQTPMGACIAAYGQVTCWDPEPRARGSRPGQCVAEYGAVACGFGCAAGYGQVRCARSAGAACYASGGEVRCTDD